jgi:hypothetical protein
MTKRFDLRTFALIMGAALIGAVWAVYNRGLTEYPYDPAREFDPLVWVVFAIPFATFWGWFIARRAERWWAAFVCFCIYFFSPFLAARYESCTVLQGHFSLTDCFVNTAQAQEAANGNGHVIYFQTIVVVHILAVLAVAIQRALNKPGVLVDNSEHDSEVAEQLVQSKAQA